MRTHLGVRLPLTLALLAGLLLPAATHAQSQPAVTCARAIVVQPGDTLSILAARHLDSPQAFAQLFAATNAAAQVDPSYAVISDPNLLVVGWKLCVPEREDDTTESFLSPTATPAPANPLPSASDSPDWQDRLVDGEPHPLTIDYLRAQTYPASPIVIERTLPAGSNYSRHIVSYRSEGLRIEALMTIPFGEPPESGWPAIIFNHGYIPPEVYRPDERYVSYVDGFARNGYVVFRPDYRGHANSEGEARRVYGAPDYTIDVLNALAAVRAHPQVDADRIGMWGHSMGGFITVRAMVTAGDIKAGVVWAGVVASYPDLVDVWRGNNTDIPDSARGWRTDLLEQYGPPEENPEFWSSISANTYASDLSGPIQLHHGTGDASVPVSFSELLYSEILAANGEAELYTYPGDDHNLSGYFSTAMQRSIVFFDEHVKAAGAPVLP